MGEIRKENLHESLVNELNELANIDLSGYQEKTDNNLVTEAKDLVGAINELFQNANNGKELIASAIGEPLNAEDTFSAMSTDINGLLATFKTNMMNNGVTVESGDRFKALIDKIATLADSEGKGIQFASGDCTTHTSGAGPTYLSASLNFKPEILLIHAITYGERSIEIIYNNLELGNSQFMVVERRQQGYLHFVDLSDPLYINNTGFYIHGNGSYINSAKYYAIGVGEEDTTLRDSLANILAEEGVSVTEEDDMASLIAKVDEEFTNDNNTISELETELAGKVTPAGTAVASDVITGKTFINSTGQLITGTASKGYTFDVSNTAGYSIGLWSTSSKWTQNTYVSEVSDTRWTSPISARVTFRCTFLFSISGGTAVTRLMHQRSNGSQVILKEVSTTSITSDNYDDLRSLEATVQIEPGDSLYIAASINSSNRWKLNSLNINTRIV